MDDDAKFRSQMKEFFLFLVLIGGLVTGWYSFGVYSLSSKVNNTNSQKYNINNGCYGGIVYLVVNGDKGYAITPAVAANGRFISCVESK